MKHHSDAAADRSSKAADKSGKTVNRGAADSGDEKATTLARETMDTNAGRRQRKLILARHNTKG